MSLRTLHFPPGPTSAKLEIYGRDLNPRRHVVDAKDSVEVPAGAIAGLALGGDELERLSLLARADLDGLSVCDPAPGIGAAIDALGISRLTLEGICAPGVMAEIAGLEALTELTFRGVLLDPESAEALGDMSQLRSLAVYDTTSKAAAAAACRLTGLTLLVIIVESAVAGALGAIGDLTSLETLALSVPDLDDSVLPRLANLRKLRWLQLDGPELRGDGIKLLADLPALSTLSISSRALALRTLVGLRESQSLRTLDIRGLPDLDDRDAALLTTISPPLRQISIYADPGENDHSPTFSLSTQVWMARARPELKVNGFALSEPAIEKYLAAGLGAHPRTGGLELTP